VPTHLSPQQLARDLAVRDLTDPHDGPHAIQRLAQAAVAALRTSWNLDVRWCRGPRIVRVEDNYDHLLIGEDAAARDARYTRYVSDRRLLRSHSSAMVPAALRSLAAGSSDDVLLACPGIVYRRDAIDWQYTGTPHQMDLWRVRRGPPMGADDLNEMVDVLLDAMVPGLEHRAEARVHPYTRTGRQVDVAISGRWIEVMECGLAHPAVLARAGLAGWHGLALGMGLDRLLMLRKGIPDIRLLRSADPRVAAQMADLAPYVPVSALPAVRRDLSIAVPADDDAELLGDRVRDALGANADAVEAVAIVGRTTWEDVPPAARERMGMHEGQVNLLVRVVLRPLDRTLTDEEANRLRDRIYISLHRGARRQLASTKEAAHPGCSVAGSAPPALGAQPSTRGVPSPS
jgi:phenylalanyl-tRNA synthetase alpha chain